MNSDNPRLKALDLLKLSSIAYLEAYKNHGEIGAVEASRKLFNEYNEVFSSKEHRESANFVATGHIESGLKENDIDEILGDEILGGSNYQWRETEQITDRDIRQFVKPQSRGGYRDDGCNEIGIIESDVDEQSKLHNGRPSSQMGPHDANKNNNVDQLTNASFEMSRSKSEEHGPNPPRKITARPVFGTKPLSNKQESPRKPRNLIGPIYRRRQDDSHDVIFPSVEIKNSTTISKPSAATVEPPKNPFTSGRRELSIQNLKNYGDINYIQPQKLSNASGPSGYIPTTKSLGGKLINKPFKSPCVTPPIVEVNPELEDPLLKGIDPKILETIKNEIINSTKDITWSDIAGLEKAKETIHEAVVMPLLRPDLFTGLRSVPKGILLFGPPGTGKTLIGKCISAQSKATFFSISASSLTSKWIGEGEKLVRALFLYARYKQPSVIFLDEIDSILTKRNESEHESSRRLKTEFLIQLEGAHTTNEEDRILLVGATNRPEELDEAARRRFTKRLYIPLPEFEGRKELIMNLMEKNNNSLTPKDVIEIAQSTDGYSGADLKNLCADAAMTCLRELSALELENIDALNLRPMTVEDFRKSLKRVKPTVSQVDLQQYIDWNQSYGSTA